MLLSTIVSAYNYCLVLLAVCTGVNASIQTLSLYTCYIKKIFMAKIIQINWEISNKFSTGISQLLNDQSSCNILIVRCSYIYSGREPSKFTNTSIY